MYSLAQYYGATVFLLQLHPVWQVTHGSYRISLTHAHAQQKIKTHSKTQTTLTLFSIFTPLQMSENVCRSMALLNNHTKRQLLFH